MALTWWLMASSVLATSLPSIATVYEDTAVTTSPARLVTVGLILAAAVMLSISTTLERHDVAIEQVRQPSGSTAPVATGGKAGPPTGHADLVFGIDVQSTPFVVGTIVVSVALAVVLLRIAAPWVAAVIALIMLACTALDILTVIHDVGQPGGTSGDILAVVVMMLHLLAAFSVAYLV